MKIGILNLPIDNNYGGHLQRYALMSVLKSMGHEPINLDCRFGHKMSLKQRIRACILSFVRMVLEILPEIKVILIIRNRLDNANRITNKFYEKYIPHTKTIYYKEGLKNYRNYDLYIVGSDQVWRKDYMKWGGTETCIDTYFFDFLPDDKKRIAYAVSFGKEEDDYTQAEINRLSILYKKFFSVSVREKSGLTILRNRKWMDPVPQWTIDPTLLLSKEEYLKIINENKTKSNKGKVLTYILDPTPLQKKEINELTKGKDVLNVGIKSRVTPTIPQWLRNFFDSEFVITDSYHGMIFSIIFNKPFKLYFNKERGSTRFNSVLQVLCLSEDSLNLNVHDWDRVNEILRELRKESLIYLSNSLTL